MQNCGWAAGVSSLVLVQGFLFIPIIAVAAALIVIAD
jgi:hypothetical protein